MDYLITFLEGVLTFLSPCVLPMVPVYLIYFMGADERRGRAFVRAAFFVAGFTAVFVALGLFAGTLGGFLVRYQKLVNIVCGGIVVVFGLHYVGVLRLRFLQRQAALSGAGRPQTALSTALFGAVFAVSWSPCVGTFLGSALMLAASAAGWQKGVGLLLCYSMGLGIPFLLCAILTEQMKKTMDTLKRHYDLVNRICGILLILVGVAMMAGLLGRLTQWLA